MNPSEIDLSPFRRAIQRLEEGLISLAQEPQNTLLRDGVIQRFEFTYELSHRMIRRFLAASAANPEEISSLSFQDMIRAAGQRGLLRSSWVQWRAFRQARTDTSHTYDESAAVQVLEVIPEFLGEARDALQRLEESRG